MAYYNLDGLKDMAQGNDDFIKNMINVFLEHTPPILDEMNDCFTRGDLTKVGELAHQIKPSIDLMGIEKLHDDIRGIELKGKEEEIDGMEDKLKNTTTILKDVFSSLGDEF